MAKRAPQRASKTAGKNVVGKNIAGSKAAGSKVAGKNSVNNSTVGSDVAGGGIDSYRRKRDFSRTPEPPPQPTRRRGREPVFVIHRHDARRLHYDLRIEMDGVLKSWAVPKGFSHDPADKRLAVRTEDHPLEYEHFDGVIPKGQYGAGTMTIWDRGRYELISGPEGLAEGKLELRLFGGRLRGEWHMVRLKKEPKNWLLFKSRDLYARGKDDPVFAIDLTPVPRTPVPRQIRRMQVGKVRRQFSNPEWLFELKLLGRRVFAEKCDGKIRFRGLVPPAAASRLNSVTAGLSKLKAERAILDGVLVCVDEQQRPSEERLQQVLLGQRQQLVYYYAFDLLYYEEWDLRRFPLAERKAALASILPASTSAAPHTVIYVDHERSRAQELMEAISSVGLAGVIAKRATSTYDSGPSDDWVEIRVPRRRPQPANVISALKTTHRKRPAFPRQVKITNQNKVLWPRDGYTKGDLIEYYDRVADYLLPYLKDRPLSLNRFPNGIEGEHFFQKDTPEHAPSWIKTEVIKSRHRRNVENRFLLCNDRATLLYLANLAAIELHPWSSRCGSLDAPDWAILDLDPSADSFFNVVRIARALGKLLQGIGLRPYLKTSGSKGLHIYVPLAAGYTYDQARMFCEVVSRLVAFEHREIATVDRVKERRGGKVYLDFLQNRRGQTIVAPYVVRPVHGACVSAPLDWDELNSDLHPSQFTIQTLPARLERRGDLFQPALYDKQDLLPAIHALNRTLERRP